MCLLVTIRVDNKDPPEPFIGFGWILIHPYPSLITGYTRTRVYVYVTYTYTNASRGLSAIADKPRDAFAQMQ